MANEHILVAEDEVHMRRTLSVILKKAGYTVSKAKDGPDALKKIKASKEQVKPIDLLLTNIQFSGMTSKELISELNRQNISLPVILLTEYEDQTVTDSFQQDDDIRIIEKPFNTKDFIKQINTFFMKRIRSAHKKVTAEVQEKTI